jgi:hypothetical protein
MTDEVLQELWRIKDANARRFNGDVDALFAELRRQHPSRLVRPARRRAASSAAATSAPAVSVAEAGGPYAATPKPAGKHRQRTAAKKENPTS